MNQKKAKLTILGSGTAMSSFYRPFDYRNEAAHLLEIDDFNILLDCSEGTRARLDRIKFDYYNLNAIFISHYHPDHFDLDPFIQSFFGRSRKDKKKLLSIYGPKNIENIFAESWNYKHRKEHYPKELGDLNLRFEEYGDGQKINLNGIEITPYKVVHMYMDAYSFRVKIGDRILAYSGDSGECEGLVESAKNADIFLCEAATNIGEEIMEGHLNPYQVGKIAKNADVNHLILTHYTGKDSPKDMLKEVKKSGFVGKANIARDFDYYYI